ncbi:hypothetical protein LV779_09005 [Streptomyces thinghirensis]|nr:hypothetical protein [Streptomyces thinghirensis]
MTDRSRPPYETEILRYSAFTHDPGGGNPGRGWSSTPPDSSGTAMRAIATAEVGYSGPPSSPAARRGDSALPGPLLQSARRGGVLPGTRPSRWRVALAERMGPGGIVLRHARRRDSRVHT